MGLLELFGEIERLHLTRQVTNSAVCAFPALQPQKRFWCAQFATVCQLLTKSFSPLIVTVSLDFTSIEFQLLMPNQQLHSLKSESIRRHITVFYISVFSLLVLAPKKASVLELYKPRQTNLVLFMKLN
jgi:hypothetical protein